MLFNFFSKLSHKKKSITFKFISDNPNDIVLSIYQNGCSPEYIASMIYAINNGLFLGKMIQNLTENNNIKNADDILSKLDRLYVLEQQDDILVKPLETFEKNAK